MPALLPGSLCPVYPDFRLEMELDGAGNGWTDMTRDLRASEPVRWGYGMAGGGPKDRVASPGELSFAFDNSHHNGLESVGAYSPVFARGGFDHSVGVRLGLSFGGKTTYKKYYVEDIAPTPGVNGERLTHVQAVDWMSEAGTYKLDGIAIQLSKRSDEIFTTIYSDITTQPANTAVATGQETFAYSLDNLRDESESALGAFQKLALSELGQIFARRDATDGETLVFEDRHARVTNTAVAHTFNGSLSGMRVSRSRGQLWNRIQVTTHHRRVDAVAADQSLFALADAIPEVGVNETISPFGPYRDPTQEAARVGGTEMITPAANTDFTINSQADGGGSDLTGDFTVTASFGANGVRWTITNNGTVTGYVTKLECRGKGVYDYARAIMESVDSAS